MQQDGQLEVVTMRGERDAKQKLLGGLREVMRSELISFVHALPPTFILIPYVHELVKMLTYTSIEGSGSLTNRKALTS